MAKRLKKFTPSRALAEALSMMDSAQVAQLEGLYNQFEPENLANAILDEFGGAVTSLAFAIKSSITSDLNMKLGSYKIATEDGKYLNRANAIGGNVVYNPDGSVKRYKFVRKRDSPRRVEVNAFYKFEAQDLKNCVLNGTFTVHECLNANKFGNANPEADVGAIRRGQELPAALLPFIRLVKARDAGGVYGGYVMGKFIPGLYSQPISKGRKRRALVINTKKYKMNVDPQFIVNSTVGNLNETRKHGEIFKKPYVNVREVVTKAEKQVESNVDYNQFKERVVEKLQLMMEFEI